MARPFLLTSRLGPFTRTGDPSASPRASAAGGDESWAASQAGVVVGPLRLFKALLSAGHPARPHTPLLPRGRHMGGHDLPGPEPIPHQRRTTHRRAGRDQPSSRPICRPVHVGNGGHSPKYALLTSLMAFGRQPPCRPAAALGFQPRSRIGRLLVGLDLARDPGASACCSAVRIAQKETPPVSVKNEGQ